MSEEHYKNDKWDITVHARGGGNPPYEYPYTGPEVPCAKGTHVYLTQYWTEWTINGIKCRPTEWLKDSLSLAGFVPQPNGFYSFPDTWDPKGQFAEWEYNGKITYNNLPSGLSDEDILQRAWFGEMYDYLKQHRPPQPPRPNDL